MNEVMMDALVVGLTMVLVEIVKKIAAVRMSEDDIKRIVIPLSVFIIAGVLNVGMCFVFTPEVAWRDALFEGLRWGAVAGGVFGIGKAALGKS